MKLSLEKFKDLHILSASGPMTPENFAVLRAGIKKQFQGGKNKIILDIPEAKSFPSDILRDLAQMNLIASELSGQIVLTSIDPVTRLKIEAFAKPTVVRSFETKQQGIDFFYPPEKKPEPIGVAPAAAAPTPTSPTSPAEKTVDQFKADIRTQEINTLGALRKTISDLEAQNKELISQLSKLVRNRRDPPDLSSWQEKTNLLEKQLEEAMTQVNAKDAPKK